MQCSRPGCPLLRHPNPANNGGTHCCAACKRTGGHGPLCRQISLEEKKKKKKGKATTTTTKATTTKATTTTTTMVTTFKSSQYPNGSNQTFNIPANKTVTATLFCQSVKFYNFGLGMWQTSRGATKQFSFQYGFPGTIVLNNSADGSCTATMSFSLPPPYPGGTGSTFTAVVQSKQYQYPIAGITLISGNAAVAVTTIWDTPPNTQYYDSIINDLNTLAATNPVGYWEFTYN